MVALCYLPAAIGVVLYSQAVGVNLLIGFVCFILGIVLTVSSPDMKQFKRMNIHLFLGTIIGHVASGILFLLTISDDSESVIIFEGIVILAVIMYILMFVTEYFIKRLMLKDKRLQHK